MLTLIFDMNDILDELQPKVESLLKVSGLEIADDIVERLFAGALDAGETVYKSVDSNRPLNLMVEADIDRLHAEGKFTDTYRGDFYIELIELCDEDDVTVRQLADLGVGLLVELMKRFLETAHTHKGADRMITQLQSDPGLPTGPDLYALDLTFQKDTTGRDAVVTIQINPNLNGKA